MRVLFWFFSNFFQNWYPEPVPTDLARYCRGMQRIALLLELALWSKKVPSGCEKETFSSGHQIKGWGIKKPRRDNELAPRVEMWHEKRIDGDEMWGKWRKIRVFGRDGVHLWKSLPVHTAGFFREAIKAGDSRSDNGDQLKLNLTRTCPASWLD